MSDPLNDIYNYRAAGADLATSGQPTEQQLVSIAAAGYSVVINLALHDDPRYSLADEAGSVKSLGMEYVHIPVQFTSPNEDDLSAFMDAMDRHGEGKIWVHCAANMRVSAFLGLYWVLRRGFE